MTRVSVIGAGFSGLSAAATLGQAGLDVTVFEKHDTAGGRARQYVSDGFTFDMGPSWYWMPDVFEKFFNQFGKSSKDYYDLTRLDPSYRIYYAKDDFLDVPATVEKLQVMFENIEPGSGSKLLQFLDEAAFKYNTGINNLVYKPGLRWSEFLDMQVVKGVFRLQLFSSFASHVRKFFSNKRLIELLEFPVLFLGATPQNTPALYSMMNYADMVLGTWYPKGGMYEIIRAMEAVAREQGVKFSFGSEVSEFRIAGKIVSGITANDTFYESDYVLASADYHHVEQHLLPREKRRYTEDYWDKRVMAPSALIYFLGVNKKIEGLSHHTLFFDKDFGAHADEIYSDPKWPSAPQFYVSCPSKTDDSVAPPGHENLFVLIPVAPGLQDDGFIREQYFQHVMGRLENVLGQDLTDHIVFKRSYAHQDFVDDYNAYKGNAYGLANTLLQTANLKPKMNSSKLSNLIYTGQLTVPGPGVPPAIISGQVAASLILNHSKKY